MLLPVSFLSQYTVRDAGYTATDEALRTVQKHPQCKWLSITNGDNIYGSEVFNRILNTAPLPDTKQLPDVVLSPVDSRNYADQGIISAELFCFHCCLGVLKDLLTMPTPLALLLQYIRMYMLRSRVFLPCCCR